MFSRRSNNSLSFKTSEAKFLDGLAEKNLSKKKSNFTFLTHFFSKATNCIPRRELVYYTFCCSLPENILSFLPKVISITWIRFSLTLEYISLMLIELSIRIFEYVSIFNNVNCQINARSDILSRTLVVIYIKIYFNNTNQQTIAFIDKHS